MVKFRDRSYNPYYLDLLSMVIGSDKPEILADIDRLRIGYKIKLYSAEIEDWQPYFHDLSLDSHQNNQLLIDRQQLLPERWHSLVFSGLALSKNNQIKEIKLVGSHGSFSGKIGYPSLVLGQRKPDIQNSSHARWKCVVNLVSDQEIQNFALIVTLDDNRQITYKKIEFHQVKLSRELEETEHKISTNLAQKIDSIHNSRQLMTSSMLQGKNYLFAIGNARSGTTALGALLNSSPEICLGIERYSLDDNVSASSFTKAAFFDAKSKNYLVRPHLYAEIKEKFDQAIYVGDKRPRFIRCWQNTWLNLPKAKIIYIFRNIYDVACSYNTRASNAALGIDKCWSSSRDFSQAVGDWNQGLQEVKKLIDFYEVYFVKYEDFFIEQSKMKHLFNYLKLNSAEPELIKGMNKIHQTALSLKNKPRTLSQEEKQYIDSQADFDSYNDILAFYEQQFK